MRVADCGVPFFLQVLIQECSADARRNARALAVEHVGAVYHERVPGPANKGRFSHYHIRLRETERRLKPVGYSGPSSSPQASASSGLTGVIPRRALPASVLR